MLGPYAAFIVTCYMLVAGVVFVLIAWTALDYRSQTAQLRALERAGVARRSGRNADDAG